MDTSRTKWSLPRTTSRHKHETETKGANGENYTVRVSRAQITNDHSPSWTYIFGLTFSCQAARARVTVATKHQQDSNGCILGATRRLARLILCSRWCRSDARNDVPGFAVSRGRGHQTTVKRHTREREEFPENTVYYHRRTALRVRPGARPTTPATLHCDARELTYYLSSVYRGKREGARCFLSDTHCAGSSCAGAAAVTCGATFPFVAVVASTVVHRRPAARMFSRGRWTASQRPSGTFRRSRETTRRCATNEGGWKARVATDTRAHAPSSVHARATLG